MTFTPGNSKRAITCKLVNNNCTTAGDDDLDFRMLAEASMSGIIVFQGEHIVYVNQAATGFLGYQKSELIGMKFWDIIHQDYRDMAKAYGFGLLKGEHSELRTEAMVIRKDGGVRLTDTLISRIRYKGRPAVLVNASDITESKRAEEALRSNEKFLNNIFNCIQDGVSILGKDLSIISYNPTIEKWHGRNIAGKKCYRVFHGRDEPCETCPSVRAMREKTMQREVVRDLIGWKEIYACPLINDDGEVTGTIEQVRDITERKQSEEALEKLRTILETSQEIAHLGSWELDLVNDKLLWSDEVYRIFGLRPREFDATYEAFLAMVHPGDRAAVDNAYNGSLRDGCDSYQIEHRIVRKSDGEVRLVHEKCHHFRDERGVITRSVGMVHDITERKRAEEDLKEAKAQAELYLDLLGHDISNLHQIAMGYLEIARDASPQAGRGEVLDKPIEVLQRSAQLVKNVLKLQKHREGVFSSQEIDVCGLLHGLQRELGAVPRKTVRLDTGGNDRCFVRANELLHDVFANLVANAIKHTGDQADINICLNVVDDGSDRYCLVSVADDGPGIPDEMKARVFNRMHKGSSSGMGLGLYLVKTLVDSYHGQVWVEDRVRGDHTKGAKFVVMLPVS